MSDELSEKAMDEWSSVCNTFTKPHIPPLDDFLDDVESFPGETFADKLKAHAEAFLGLPHISESEKRQKEPGMGVSVDALKSVIREIRDYVADEFDRTNRDFLDIYDRNILAIIDKAGEL